jgi:glycosyltransferase involved in cell wall biosynthesis
MASAAVLILPTRADTSPNSVKEAVVAGLPVVASAVGGILDHVRPGENGFTFEPGNLAGLEAAILKALEHPTFKHGAVPADSLARSRELLSPSMMADKFISTYRQVTDSVAGASAHTKF